MEANSTHISLETAKLLKDCKIESEYKFFFDNYDKGELKCSISNNEHFLQNIVRTYPAYTWQEILWENNEVFFINPYKYDWNTKIILDLLQQKKYDEADKYFRENCILIKK
jgi:hypothetical protein